MKAGSSPQRSITMATYSTRPARFEIPWTRGASPMMSFTFIRGLREAYGSWKIICTLRACLRSSFDLACDGSTPRYLTDPSEGWIRPATIRPSVDFPQPDSPTRPTTSPRAIEKQTPSTARTILSSILAPNFRATFSERSRFRENRLERDWATRITSPFPGIVSFRASMVGASLIRRSLPDGDGSSGTSYPRPPSSQSGR